MEGLQEALAGAVTPLERTREQLAEREKALAANLGEVREGLKTIDRVLRAAGLSPVEEQRTGGQRNGRPAAKKGGSRQRGREHASPGALEKVRDAVAKLDHDFTINQVSRTVGGMDKSVISRALDDLRDEGSVRLVGRGWPHGEEKKGRQSNLYRAVG